MEIDRSVFYAIALRGWQLVAGAVSLLLISIFLSAEQQGYYFTFASLLLMQTFFELGMHVVIVSHASHQWSKLELDQSGRVVGDPESLSRLASLLRIVVKWFAAMSFAFLIVVGCAGHWFFQKEPVADVDWQSPWWSVVVLTGLLLCALPLNAILEGCNQVKSVYLFRLVQAVLANLAVWTSLVAGAGLWIAVAAVAVKLVCDTCLLGVCYRRFFLSLFQQVPGPQIHWWTDIWPMQWRLAISVAFFYFESAIFTPIIFHFHGPVAAGQMGMTWTLIGTLQMGALAWLQARAPLFGVLVAERNYTRLDAVFRRLTTISNLLLAAAVIAVVGGVCLVHYVNFSLADRIAARILPPIPTALLGLAAISAHLPRCQDTYLRAHRREPQLGINIVSSTLIGVLALVLGHRYGATGVAAALAAVSVLVTLPAKFWLWNYCRRQWHR